MEALINRREVEKIDPKARMDLLDRIMEAHSQLTWVGVQPNDLHPRNYMVWKDLDDLDRWRITLIDFSHSFLVDHPTVIGKAGRCPNPQLPPWDTVGRLGASAGYHTNMTAVPKESYDRSLIKWMKKKWECSSEYGPASHKWLPKPRSLSR